MLFGHSPDMQCRGSQRGQFPPWECLYLNMLCWLNGNKESPVQAMDEPLHSIQGNVLLRALDTSNSGLTSPDSCR